jgi:rhodanese-related sulfurtransferase
MPVSKSRKKSYPWIVVLLSITALGLVVIGVRAGLSSRATSAKGYSIVISAQQAQKELALGAMLLDVRERDEYTQSHISGSLWIPLGELTSWLDELPSDSLIIVVCQTGVRAARGRDILLAAGYTKVTSLSGGMQAWVAAGYPVESGPPPNP